ncbi:MAG: hypothetical protein CVT79_16500 [Alphaproteobacteria bacterium HGW-Alphaproteobacteria-18]|nr:MAG: hypothetical protein CVT79_16500 [Alphaproteobacteria bacterium HGW-Alphaproteobacteria-18]
MQGKVSDVALSSGSGAILAVAYEAGGLEFFDMEGDRLGEPTRFHLKDLADGRSATIQGTHLTLFPGVTQDGTLKAYVFGEGLVAPAQIDLPIPEERMVEGLCTGEAGTQGLMRIAYWTMANNRVLRTGIVSQAGEDLTWTEEAATEAGFPITSCVFAYDTLVASPRSAASASLTRGENSALLSIEEGGPLQISTDLGMTTSDVMVRDGITVTAPNEPTAVSAHGSLPAGGYPGGVVVIAGETSEGTHQVVFVDPSAITLKD